MAVTALLVASLIPVQAHGQSFVSARAEFWGLHSGHLATLENRTAVALEGGVLGSHASLELGLRYSRLRILSGANADESLSGLSVGSSFLVR